MKYRIIALAVFATALPASGGIIVTETASGLTNCCRVVTGYSSWIQSVTYTNVTIAANLFDAGETTATGVAYLMNQIGPGTTAANEVTAPFNISITNTASAPVTLFSGLTLGPGNYFLVVNPTNCCLDWDNATNTSVRTLGTGVTQTAFPNLNQGTIAAFPPATDFAFTGQALYSVTGDLATSGPVPEPATGAVVLAGISALLWMRRRPA